MSRFENSEFLINDDDIIDFYTVINNTLCDLFLFSPCWCDLNDLDQDCICDLICELQNDYFNTLITYYSI